MKRPRRAYLIGGGILLLAVLAVAVFAPQLTQVSPDYWDAKTSLLLGTPPFPPGPGHPLGTDQWGRDIWSRVAFGTRWSLLFAFLIMAGRLLIAMPAALLGAFGPRRLGWLIDRCYVITSAIPPLLVYILLLSPPQLRLIGLGPSVTLTVALLTLVEWPRVAVMLKGRLEGLLAEPFVEGAVAAGSTRWQLFKNHLFPHLWPVLLQLIAAEMARALLAIAQLAVFGIMVGGGIVSILDDGHGGDKYVLTTGIAEWGSMLSDGRIYTLSKPWIPLAPACAFLTAMVGFSLFSQGLETLQVSIQAIKDATTGRMSRRWRWAWALVAAGLVFWYFGGLPWGREAGITALADRQAGALTAHDTGTFDATLAPAAWGQDPDLSRWAAQLAATDYERVTMKPDRIQLRGSRATATWNVEIGYRSSPPKVLSFNTDLVRRLGRWYLTGEPYASLRGYHADVVAQFDPVDPSPRASTVRWQVQYLATAADHAYEAVAALFPDQAEAPRPRLLLYPSQADYQHAVGTVDAGTVSYAPGEAIRVSPDFIKGGKRWDVERTLAHEMIQFLTRTRLGKDQTDPLLVGAFDLSVDKELSTYRINVERLAGQPLLTLPELYSTHIGQLSEARLFTYVTQSALLTEFAKNHLNSQVPKAANPAELAAALGMTQDELAAQYWTYAVDRIYSESLLTSPAAKARIPEGLAEAIAARAAAATAGDAAAFNATLRPSDQAGHDEWLAAAEKKGLTAYRARLLLVQADQTGARVQVLEELTFNDGTTTAGVVTQTWTQSSTGAWVAGPVTSIGS